MIEGADIVRTSKCMEIWALFDEMHQWKTSDEMDNEQWKENVEWKMELTLKAKT